MVRTSKRGKRKTDESEETALETLESNDTSSVDEMKENELKSNGANFEVSAKKLCNSKETVSFLASFSKVVLMNKACSRTNTFKWILLLNFKWKEKCFLSFFQSVANALNFTSH